MALGYIFATNGSPARLGLIHLDAVTEIETASTYTRTTTALEFGAPINRHRQREAARITLNVTISDAEPGFGTSVIGLWELNHARKTRDRLLELQDLGIEATFFDGREFRRTPSGSRVWVIDEISERTAAPNDGIWEARIVLGESRRAATLFTAGLAAADAVADEVGGVAEEGLQSGFSKFAEQLFTNVLGLSA